MEFVIADANVAEFNSTALKFPDQKEARFGGNSDLRLYHDGHSIIRNDESGAALFIASHETIITNTSFNEAQAKFFQNGAAELYYDNGKKFETTTTGGQVHGSLNVTGDHIVGGELNLMQGTTNTTRFIDASLADGQALFIRATQGGDANHENMALLHRNTGVLLYYDNSQKFQTTSAGIDVTGRVTADDLTVENTSGNLSAMFTATNGLGTLEIGGSTGAFIDLKTPFSDDFDLSLIHI